jgi:NAD(P)-dependent dehydrogenase (short-subunit alcohol dehydrogenase family)
MIKAIPTRGRGPENRAQRFLDRTVLVSGGAGGMGRAASLMFAAEGAKVGILDIAEKDGLEAEHLIREAGGTAVFVKADASNASEVASAIAKVNQQFGPINVLFNHTGTISVKAFHLTTEAEYDHLMDINVRSAFLVCKAVVAQMLENGGGSIVITSSNGGEMGFALESVYCMTKGAVLQLARSISTEYRSRNIRCNAICPGFVKTAHGLREIKELDGMGQKWDNADLVAAQVRICEPEEAAAAALFLASDDASFISGAALYVDNGWFAKG